MQAGIVEKSYVSLLFFCFKEVFILYFLAPYFSAAVQPRASA